MRNARDIGTQRLRVCPAHVTGGKEKKREREREGAKAREAGGGREGARITYKVPTYGRKKELSYKGTGRDGRSGETTQRDRALALAREYCAREKEAAGARARG